MVTPNEGFLLDVRVKVSRTHGGRGHWPDAASVAVRPQPREIVPGSLMTADFAAVGRWIDLNQAVIVDYWDGSIDIDEGPPASGPPAMTRRFHRATEKVYTARGWSKNGHE